MDSGAFSLYNKHVLKSGEKPQPKGDPKKYRGTELLPPKHTRSYKRADFSHYDLTPGSEFRRYCDFYASWIRKVESMGTKMGSTILATTVDAITNPEKTWEIQQYFEKEHGLYPVPVIHAGTDIRWLEKYVETGNYDLIGLGGMGHSIPRATYVRWGDSIYRYLCPKSNGYKPIVRTHGFAMTSWELICRWPWWSVDSATWVKLSAYGWLYVPPLRRGKWSFDEPPIQINLSAQNAPQKSKRDKHFETSKHETLKETVHKWLERCNLTLGEVDDDGKEVEFGVSSHFRARSIANLHYLKDLEESRPEWPNPLSMDIVNNSSAKYVGAGFGL